METTEPDTFTALTELVAALDVRFPDHNGPFERVTRLCEEAGELAGAVNHTEGTGLKNDKHGPPDTEHLVKEVGDVLRAAVGIALHYQVVDQLRASIHHHHRRHQDMGYIPGHSPVGGADGSDNHGNP